jgi:DNA-binding transcriptional LysR family regulator
MEPIAPERLRGIGTFVQVMEAGSFAAAAARLRVTRSAVAKSMSRLEQRLGTQLFGRSTRRLSPTEAAHAYYEQCKAALAQIESAEAALASGHDSPRGLLRVSAPATLGRIWVVPTLSGLSGRHDDFRIAISLEDRRVDLLAEGYDLVVRTGTLADSSSLQARTIGQQRFSLFAAPAYLRRHGNPRTLADLQKHLAIAYGRDARPAPWRIQLADAPVAEVQARYALSLDDIDAIAAAAVAGYGIARLPQWMARDWLVAGALAPVLPDTVMDDSEVHVVWPRARHLPMKTRAAIDLLSAKAHESFKGAHAPARARHRSPGVRK